MNKARAQGEWLLLTVADTVLGALLGLAVFEPSPGFGSMIDLPFYLCGGALVGFIGVTLVGTVQYLQHRR